MTMRLDIVTNDAGDLVRREHARELGAGVVVAIYRLVKLAQMHDLGNQAFLRQLEQTHQLIGEYGLRSGSNVSVLFAVKATFVAGQLLKGSRGAYEMSAELGGLLERLGGSELNIARDITREDCLAFAEAISTFHRTGNANGLRLPPKVRLRRVADAARLRGIELEDLSQDQRIVRAYASAVVIMRRFFDDLSASRYVLPRRVKRIAQSLVDLSDHAAASFLGVTEVRNANFDEAGRAVNTAILAVSIARESTHDRTALCQIAMAAMMHDVARPRALALAGAGGAPMPGMAGPTTLSEDQEDRLAAGAAAVLTALGRVNEPTITRTVLTFEALWLRRKQWLGPVYWGARAPTLHATIIAVARRYNDLLTPEPGLPPPTTDYAVAMLAKELTDPQDRTVLRMLVSALALLPTGTVVQLATGEVAEVVRGSRGLGDRPRVRVTSDPNGVAYAQPVEIEISQDPRRSVERVLSVEGWLKGLAQDELHEAPDSDGVPVSVPPPPHASRSVPAPHAAPRASWSGDRSDDNPSREGSGASGEHPASASMPSLGSSPSAVAEAMGRMINDSLAPPAMPPRETDRPDRTVVQPTGTDEPPRRNVATTITREPTARGNLAATPLPHVLVYMLDHALTGSVVFEGTAAPGAAQDDTIYFVNGVPAKIRLSDTVALLGEVLVSDGTLDARTVDQAVDGARRLGILIGEFLVGHDLVSREALAWALEGQLLRKIGHVANLAPEIEYAFYRDVDLLEAWGGDIAVTHPLNPILASVRHWTDRARVKATLNRIGKHPLVLHPDSELANLAVHPEEKMVLEAIRAESAPMQELFDRRLADEEVASSLVYALAVTRQFAFKGQKKGPMAAVGAAWRSVAPGSSMSSGPSPFTGAVSSGPRPSASFVASKPQAPPPPPPPPPPSPEARLAARVGPPSAQMRAGAQSVPSQRAMPAARPGMPALRPANAPQIRPIVAKKTTMLGLQPSAPSAGRRSPSSSPPDDARTVALMAPSTPGPGASPGPRLPKSSPNPPTRPAIRSPQQASASRVPVAAAQPIDPDETAPVEVPSRFDLPEDEPASARPRGGTLEIGDAGLADAEAALEAMQSFRLAEAALQRRDLQAAEDNARKAVDGDPSQPDYLTLLAWIRSLAITSMHGLDEPIRTMSKVLIEDPSNERALFYRAKLLVRTNRLPEAMHDLEELLAGNPGHREAQAEAQRLRTRLQT